MDIINITVIMENNIIKEKEGGNLIDCRYSFTYIAQSR